MLEWLFLCTLSLFLAGGLAWTDATQRIDNLIYDAIARWDVPPADSNIIIVGIDNQSLANIGRWPWSRTVHAEAIRHMVDAHPTAIVYDILYVDPTPEDAILAGEMAKSGPVFLPLLLEVPGPDGQHYAETKPVPPLAAIAQLGHVIARPDSDGVLRRAMLSQHVDQKCWPHMMLVVAAYINHLKQDCKTGPAAGFIPYTGPAGSYVTIPFSAVLKGEVPDAVLANKILLVGATASGLGDQYATPMQSRSDLMPGVEIQANLLDALLRNDMRQNASTPWQVCFAFVPLCILWAGFLFFTPRRNLMLAIILLTLILAMSAAMLIGAKLWLHPAPAILTMTLFLPIWGWRRLAAASGYFIEELDRLRQEPGVLGITTKTMIQSDPLERQMILLGDAVQQVRMLKHFIEESHASLPDATLVINTKGQVELANARSDILALHYGIADPRGNLRSLFLGLRPHIVEGRDVLDALANKIADGNSLEQECEIGMADGRAYLMRMRPCFDSDNILRFTIFRLTDITELRTAARQRDHMLQFLTHDMRSPQASIIALLQQADDKTISKDLTRRIEGHARQTLYLADEFVQIARAEATQYEMEILDLADLLDEAADQLWALAQEHTIQIHCEKDGEDLLVNGNSQLLSRAMSNVIGNAIKYSFPGGRITVRTYAKDAEHIACSIQDEGRGMTEEEQSRLFQRFARFGNTNDRDGAGLGLVLVRTVVARHNGTIQCVSAPGKGSCFTITLPRVALE